MMKKINILVVFMFYTLFSLSQDKEVAPIYKSYRAEKKSDFEFTPFTRGFDSKKTSKSLDSLDQKPTTKWNFEDSLILAVNLMRINSYKDANLQFQLLNCKKIKDPLYFRYCIMSYQLVGNFSAAEDRVKIFKKLFPDEDIGAFEVVIKYNLYFHDGDIDHKWLSKNHIIPFNFGWEDISQDTVRYNFTLKLLKAYNDELHFQTTFIYEDDPIISAIAYDMGLILEKHFSYSEAYIAYSLSRQYDKSNKHALENLKRVKGIMNENKYSLPVFRRYFPRKNKGRFNYEILKSKMWDNTQVKDSTSTTLPIMRIPDKQDEEQTFLDQIDTDLLYIIVLFIFLVLVLIFVRVK